MVTGAITSREIPDEWTNLAGQGAYGKVVATLRGRLPRDQATMVENEPFDQRAHARKYYKEFQEKKLMDRIKKG